MSENLYVLAEYNALREEIRQESAQLAVVTRYSLSVILGLYAAPFALKSDQGLAGWVLVMIGVDLALIAFAARLIAATEGVRKLGSYISVVIEPKTQGALQYETLFHETFDDTSSTFGETGMIVILVSSLHVVAAAIVAGAVVNFPRIPAMLILVSVAAFAPVILIVSKPSRRRMFGAKRQRDEFVQKFRAWRADHPDTAQML